MQKIGFIGLGIMGRPMAKNLLAAGFDLTFHARRAEVIMEMQAAGATSVASPREVAEQVDIVITIVTADKELKEVVLAPTGVLAGLSEGKLLVDMSTVSPVTVRELGQALADKNASIVDAPVSGGEDGAIAGLLTIIAGGNAEDFERCRPLFEAMGDKQKIYHVGEAGTGQTIKLVNQVMAGVNAVAMAEAMKMGVSAGADPQVMREVLGVSSGTSTVFKICADPWLKQEFEPGFMLKLMEKDVGLGVELGKSLGVAMPVGEAGLEMFRVANQLGAGDEQFGAVCRAVDHLSS